MLPALNICSWLRIYIRTFHSTETSWYKSPIINVSMIFRNAMFLHIFIYLEENDITSVT